MLLVHIGIVFNISKLLLISVHVNNGIGLHYYCAKLAFFYCVSTFIVLLQSHSISSYSTTKTFQRFYYFYTINLIV